MGYISVGLYSVAIVLFILGSSGLQMYGVLQEEERDHTQDWKYLVPAALMNIIVIMLILFPLMKSKIFGTVGKSFAVILLLGGFLAETMLTTLYYSDPEVYAVYAVLAVNFIVRLAYFIILQLSLGPEIAKQASAAAEEAKKALLEAKKMAWLEEGKKLGFTASSSSGSEKKSDSGSSSGESSAAKDFQSQWDKILNDIKKKNPGVTIWHNDADKVIKEAKASGDFSQSKLDQAKAKVTGKNNTAISKGGRRHR